MPVDQLFHLVSVLGTASSDTTWFKLSSGSSGWDLLIFAYNAPNAANLHTLPYVNLAIIELHCNESTSLYLSLLSLTHLVCPLVYPFPRQPPARENLTALVLVADGTEELEAVSVVELLRRAGIRTTVVGASGPGAVTCKFGMTLTPDASLTDVLDQDLHDLVVIPGGEQAANYMSQSEEVGLLLSNHEKGDCYFGAISSGPLVLDAHNIKYLCRLTSSPEYMEKLHKHYSYYNHEDTIVDVSARVVTGRYPGRVFEFALSLINHVADLKTANKVSYDIFPYTMV